MSLNQIGAIETTIESVKNSDKDSTLMESKNISHGPHGACLGPITPCLTEEKVKFNSQLEPKVDDDYPSTPMEDVFDVCVTGPIQKSNIESSVSVSVSRKLDFDSNGCVSGKEFENGTIMETVYESVLEAIICKQAEDILAEILASDSSSDPLKTPPSVARVTGVAETCPGAPLKPKQGRNKRTVGMSLCRKLDFDSCV